MTKISRNHKNALSMAHDTSLVLNLLASKVQKGEELSKEDLSALPTIANYSSHMLKTLLDALPEGDAEEAEEPKSTQSKRGQKK